MPVSIELLHTNDRKLLHLEIYDLTYYQCGVSAPEITTTRKQGKLLVTGISEAISYHTVANVEWLGAKGRGGWGGSCWG